MLKSILYNKLKYLPLLEYTETLFSKNHLTNVFVIACQHILPSTHMLIRSMINLGLDTNKVSVIGKCYSTNHTVMKNMLNEGIFVCESSTKFEPHSSFDEQFCSSIKSFLHKQIDRMQPSKNSTIIILDDGGELISAAQELADLYPNIIGVEQTSSGYNKLAYTPINFPVKNVALSKEKLDFETPFIARSFISNLEKKISLSMTDKKEILIVGNGYVGKGVNTILRTNKYAHHNVTSYDVVQERSDTSYINFSDFDLIIGATGNRMMTYNYYDLLKSNAILVSISSSDREFDAVYFRKLSGLNSNIHDDIFYNGLCLLNSGFPLNFSGGDIVSVPLHKIQLVCALLLLGVCEFENCNMQQKHFVQLDKEFTNKILNKFSKIDRDDYVISKML